MLTYYGGNPYHCGNVAYLKFQIKKSNKAELI